MRRRGGVLVDITPQQFIEQTRVPFIYSLIAEVRDAFINYLILQAFESLDPRNLPDNMQKAMATNYGHVIKFGYLINIF